MKKMAITQAALAALLMWSVPAQAQQARPSGTAAQPQSAPRTILFVGNSFTQGAHSPVKRFRADTVTDLNDDGYGGVPALFKAFAEQAGLNYAVSLETQGGKTLGFHYEERRAKIDRAWDVVVLQELSTLDRDRPGDPANYLKYAPMLASMMKARNPAAQVLLMATWSRADQVYRPGSPWSSTPIDKMARDLRTASDRVRASSRTIDGVIPVGEAWNRAFAGGVADPNPYDGTTFGQVDLWTYDQYHASMYGYYLEALVVFGHITGVDPRTLGKGEKAAADLGISPAQASALQAIAGAQLSSQSTSTIKPVQQTPDSLSG